MNKVGLVLLAGGRSSRMNTPKGLLRYKNRYWMEEQIARFSKVGKHIYIGLGFDADLYLAAMPWLKPSILNTLEKDDLYIQTVINTVPEKGFFSTLQTVLNTSVEQEHLLILPIDCPLMTVGGIQQLLLRPKQVAIPTFQGKKGHPVLINADFCAKLLTIHVDQSDARLDKQIKQLSNDDIELVAVNDEQIILNMNTPIEWQNYVEAYQ